MVIEIEKSKQKRMQRVAREEWQEKKENITK